MKYRLARTKIFKLLESDLPTNYRYLKIRELLEKMGKPQKTKKEQLKEIFSLLQRIYNEPSTAGLCKRLTNGDLRDTPVFLSFLEKVINEN